MSTRQLGGDITHFACWSRSPRRNARNLDLRSVLFRQPRSDMQEWLRSPYRSDQKSTGPRRGTDVRIGPQISDVLRGSRGRASKVFERAQGYSDAHAT